MNNKLFQTTFPSKITLKSIDDAIYSARLRCFFYLLFVITFFVVAILAYDFFVATFFVSVFLVDDFFVVTFFVDVFLASDFFVIFFLGVVFF